MNWDVALKIVSAAIGAVGGASLLVVALSSWLGKVWANRILESDRQKYANQLETLKTTNENYINSLSLTHSAYLENSKAFTEKRITAIQVLWEEVVRLRDERPSPIIWLDILMPSEYGHFKTNPKLQHAEKAVDFESIAEAMKSDADLVRPFLDDRAYQIYWSYRALTARLCHFIQKIYSAGATGKSWREDDGVIKILETALTEYEVKKMNGEKWSTSVTFNYLEGLLTNHLRELGSGTKLGERTLTDSMKFYRAAAELKKEHEKSS